MKFLPPQSTVGAGSLAPFQVWEVGSWTPNKVCPGDDVIWYCGWPQMSCLRGRHASYLVIEPFTLAGWGPLTVQGADIIGKYPRKNGRKLPEFPASPPDCPSCQPKLQCLLLYLAESSRELPGPEQEMWEFSTQPWQTGVERSKASGSLTSFLVFRPSDLGGWLEVGDFFFFFLVFHL